MKEIIQSILSTITSKSNAHTKNDLEKLKKQILHIKTKLDKELSEHRKIIADSENFPHILNLELRNALSEEKRISSVFPFIWELEFEIDFQISELF